MILTDEEIKHFQENQELITYELLEALRLQGDEGKKLAIEILETPKNERRYYVDAFGIPISMDGNKALKKPGTILPLKPIHEQEIERCANDFDYFRRNYIQIKTPTGIGFPEMRDYQQRLIDAMLDDDNEEIVGLIGRQCIDGDTRLDLEDMNISIKELFDNPENSLSLDVDY